MPIPNKLGKHIKRDCFKDRRVAKDALWGSATSGYLVSVEVVLGIDMKGKINPYIKPQYMIDVFNPYLKEER